MFYFIKLKPTQALFIVRIFTGWEKNTFQTALDKKKEYIDLNSIYRQESVKFHLG